MISSSLSLLRKLYLAPPRTRALLAVLAKAIDLEAEIKKVVPKDEGKGKSGVNLSAIVEFKEKRAKRIVLKGSKG